MTASREILKDNLKALMNANSLDTQLSLVAYSIERGHPIAQSMISRMKAGKTDIDTGTLDNLAAVFGIEAWRLIAPNLGGPSLQSIVIGGRQIPSPVGADRTAHIPPPPSSPKVTNPKKKKTQG